MERGLMWVFRWEGDAEGIQRPPWKSARDFLFFFDILEGCVNKAGSALFVEQGELHPQPKVDPPPK